MNSVPSAWWCTVLFRNICGMPRKEKLGKAHSLMRRACCGAATLLLYWSRQFMNHTLFITARPDKRLLRCYNNRHIDRYQVKQITTNNKHDRELFLNIYNEHSMKQLITSVLLLLSVGRRVTQSVDWFKWWVRFAAVLHRFALQIKSNKTTNLWTSIYCCFATTNKHKKHTDIMKLFLHFHKSDLLKRAAGLLRTLDSFCLFCFGLERCNI